MILTWFLLHLIVGYRYRSIAKLALMGQEDHQFSAKPLSIFSVMRQRYDVIVPHTYRPGQKRTAIPDVLRLFRYHLQRAQTFRHFLQGAQNFCPLSTWGTVCPRSANLHSGLTMKRECFC